MQTITEFKNEYAFLSNFDTKFSFNMASQGMLQVPSGEHGFQALKTQVASERKIILNARTPTLAKKAGRNVTLRLDWMVGGRMWAMRQVLFRKFQVPYYKESLLMTQNAYLVEGNMWHDNFWGDCQCGDRRHNCSRARGTNMLGQLLMALRTGMMESVKR